MALTRVKSKVVSNYIQPALGDTVSIVIATDIDWIKVGMNIYVAEGGVYEVVSIVANAYTIKLIKGEAPESSQVLAKVVFPSGSGTGGGDNVKYTEQTLTEPEKTQARTNIGAASKTYVVQELYGTEPIGSDTDYIICYYSEIGIEIDIPDPANHPGRVIKITYFNGAGYVNFIGYPIKPFEHHYEVISQLGGWVTANPELTIPRSVEIISTGTQWVVIHLTYGHYQYYPPYE